MALTVAVALVWGGWLALAGAQEDCGPSALSEDRPTLGLMSSLPLFWPLDADIADLVGDEADVPWQRELLERSYDLKPLDTLTSASDLAQGRAPNDPLEGLDYLVIVQPRGLSPAGNVALDNWVRAGGDVLMVLDPELTGSYALPLGDPRRPSPTALIPPVVEHWGIAPVFDHVHTAQVEMAELPFGAVPLLIAGEVRLLSEESQGNGCRVLAHPVMARCDSVGEGSVTYLADAAIFEHRELAGEESEGLLALLDFAFSE